MTGLKFPVLIISAIAFMFSACSPVNEIEEPVESRNLLDVRLLEDQVYSSENAVILIVLQYSRDLIPIIPDFKAELEPVRIISIEDKGTRSKGFILRQIEIKLDNLVPGEYLLSPISVTLIKNGDVIQELESGFIPLKVNSQLIGDGEYIDQFQEMKKPAALLVLLTAVFVIIAGAGIIFLIIRMKIKTIVSAGDKDFSELLKEAESIGSDRKYYMRLSAIVREFLDCTIFPGVQSRTTEEFIQIARNTDLINDQVKHALFDFLQNCDRISFGKYDQSCDRNRDALFCSDFMAYVRKQIRTEVPE
ncbi:MAG: hypothetical protein EH225_04100 [Calditrichaeota bacterium]|nr:MAG: hypothetical protein EH225_04100 [Calditrichota bacterium]